MADYKYIMLEANGALVPIIFPGELIHADVYKYMGMMVRDHVIKQKPGDWSSSLVSAGFIANMAVSAVYGKSETLNDLASKVTDASIINLMPYEGGRESMVPNVEAMMLYKQCEFLLNRIKELTDGS